MNNKASLIFLFILLLGVSSSNAQKSFEKGYIIKTTTSDTIWGQIDYRNWSSNPKQIAFKPDSGALQKVGVTDINEFAVTSDRNNEIYRKKILDIDKGSINVADLKNYSLTEISRDTVFATLYESGKINLYYLRDENARVHFLIEKNDTGIRELRIEKYLKSESSGVQSNDIYKNQLSILMSDCGGVIMKLSDLSYNEKEMRKLVAYYNTCVVSDRTRPKYSQTKEKVDFFIAPVIGLGFRTERISNTQNYDLANVFFGPSFNIDIALAIGIVMPRTNKHFELGTELGWGYFRESKTTSSGQNNMSATLAAHLFKLNILVRYLVPVKKVKFVFIAGLSTGFILTSVNQLNETSNYLGIPNQTSQDAIPMGNFQIASILGAGLRIKNISMELRYFLCSSLANGAYIRTFPNSLNFTFSYNFWINKDRKTLSK